LYVTTQGTSRLPVDKPGFCLQGRTSGLATACTFTKKNRGSWRADPGSDNLIVLTGGREIVGKSVQPFGKIRRDLLQSKICCKKMPVGIRKACVGLNKYIYKH
jgi:hypothetical protein